MSEDSLRRIQNLTSCEIEVAEDDLKFLLTYDRPQHLIDMLTYTHARLKYTNENDNNVDPRRLNMNTVKHSACVLLGVQDVQHGAWIENAVSQPSCTLVKL